MTETTEREAKLAELDEEIDALELRLHELHRERAAVDAGEIL